MGHEHVARRARRGLVEAVDLVRPGDPQHLAGLHVAPRQVTHLVGPAAAVRRAEPQRTLDEQRPQTSRAGVQEGVLAGVRAEALTEDDDLRPVGGCPLAQRLGDPQPQRVVLLAAVLHAVQGHRGRAERVLQGHAGAVAPAEVLPGGARGVVEVPRAGRGAQDEQAAVQGTGALELREGHAHALGVGRGARQADVDPDRVDRRLAHHGADPRRGGGGRQVAARLARQGRPRHHAARTAADQCGRRRVDEGRVRHRPGPLDPAVDQPAHGVQPAADGPERGHVAGDGHVGLLPGDPPDAALGDPREPALAGRERQCAGRGERTRAQGPGHRRATVATQLRAVGPGATQTQRLDPDGDAGTGDHHDRHRAQHAAQAAVRAGRPGQGVEAAGDRPGHRRGGDPARRRTHQGAGGALLLALGQGRLHAERHGDRREVDGERRPCRRPAVRARPGEAQRAAGRHQHDVVPDGGQGVVERGGQARDDALVER